MKTERKFTTFATALIMFIISFSIISAASYSWPIGNTGGFGGLNITNQNNTATASSSPHYGYWTTVESIVYRGSTVVSRKTNAGVDYSYTSYIDSSTTLINGRFSVDGQYRLEGLYR